MNLFSLIIGAGGSIGLLRILQKSDAALRLRCLLAGVFSMAGAVIGGRAGFAAAYHVYYSTHTQEIIRIDKGGLSWPGALAGAILFGWITLLIFKLPILKGLDLLSRMLLPISAAVWLGAWQSGIAFGQLLPSDTWWGLMIRDESGLTALRVPVQPAAVVSLLLVLGMVEWLMRPAKKEGLKAAVSFVVLSLHSLLFSFMRYDSVQSIFGLRLDSWATVFFSIISLIFLAIMLFKKTKFISDKNISE